MKQLSIIKKIGVLFACGAVILSASYLQVNGEEPSVPLYKSFDLKGYYGNNPYTYEGELQKVFHIDIDRNGIKDTIAQYDYCGEILYDYNLPSVDYVYDIYLNGTDTPVPVCADGGSLHSHPSTYIVRDNNTGETFIGCYGDASCSLWSLYPESKTIIKDTDENFNEYMKNVEFLSLIAYGKGDTDGDAEVTLSDAAAILSCYAENSAGLACSFDSVQETAGDFDGDGAVTINDAGKVLSLYAECASGIVETPFLPSSVHMDYSEYFLRTGDLESVFYLDIDSDGVKETIGRYINTNSENDESAMQCAPYIYQLYDNGRYEESFGFNSTGGTCREQYVLIADHNRDITYLACIGASGIPDSFHYSFIDRKYDPNLTRIAEYTFFDENEESFKIYDNNVTKEHLLEYISNLEILYPYGDENINLMSLF